MKLPYWRSVHSYRAVSPALMYGCVSPPTPSIPLGRYRPCQWTEVATGKRFVT
jgi:hypothetical protein